MSVISYQKVLDDRIRYYIPVTEYPVESDLDPWADDGTLLRYLDISDEPGGKFAVLEGPLAREPQQFRIKRVEQEPKLVGEMWLDSVRTHADIKQVGIRALDIGAGVLLSDDLLFYRRLKTSIEENDLHAASINVQRLLYGKDAKQSVLPPEVITAKAPDKKDIISTNDKADRLDESKEPGFSWLTLGLVGLVAIAALAVIGSNDSSGRQRKIDEIEEF